MKKVMKKITYLLIAAMSVVSVASCVKELTPDPEFAGNAGGVKFTVSLPAETRTALAEGKTVWAEGDSIWVSNGTYSESIVVPESAWGKKEFEFVTNVVKDTIQGSHVYVVYPYSAAAGVADDKVSVTVPYAQYGFFKDANIMAAVSKDFHVTMRNVTALFKITVAEAVSPVFSLAVSAAEGKALTGKCSIDFSGDDPVITPDASASPNATMQVDGRPGDYYLSVIPGTFAPGFKVTAATVDFAHASESKVSTVENTVKASDMVDLGVIGTNLQSLSGEGTSANPYLIESAGHMIALATQVNMGMDFADTYFKVANDIEGVTTSVGYEDEENLCAFCGTFDGNNKTITLNINGGNSQGLFGVIGPNAVVRRVKLAGSVVGADYVGALAGQIYSTEDAPIQVYNITSSAQVTGNNSVGGIVGYAGYYVLGDDGKEAAPTNRIELRNCTNNGTVTGKVKSAGGVAGQIKYVTFTSNNNYGAVTGEEAVGGAVGYAYLSEVNNSSNGGPVVSTSEKTSGVYVVYPNGSHQNNGNPYNTGTGGVVGWSQNTNVKSCNNTASVKGGFKVGGIVASQNWGSISDCNNSGSVEATLTYSYNISSQTGQGFGSLVGGILGWGKSNTSITNCVNSGTIKGRGGQGGIAGLLCNENNANSGFTVKDCKNTGAIIAQNVSNGGGVHMIGFNTSTGGIVGMNAVYLGHVAQIIDCVNEGDVSSDKAKVGGILGSVLQSGSNINAANIGNTTMNGCVNKGKVTGTYLVGGIMGSSFARFLTKPLIKNCSNYGTITATASGTIVESAANASGVTRGAFVGGLVGASSGWYLKSGSTDIRGRDGHLTIYNSVNYGDVLYAEADNEAPYAGGIVGYMWGNSTFQNNYNAGFVGTVSRADPAEGAMAYLGELAGRQFTNAVHYSYYSLVGSVAQPVGTSGTAARTDTVCEYDEEGILTQVVTANGVGCSTLMQVLNEWQNYYVAYDYNNWTGPANKPVHDTTKD